MNKQLALVVDVNATHVTLDANNMMAGKRLVLKSHLTVFSQPAPKKRIRCEKSRSSNTESSGCEVCRTDDVFGEMDYRRVFVGMYEKRLEQESNW